MKQYPEMKDSSVKWLGCIPAHWGILRGKRFFYTQKIKNDGNTEKNILSLTLKGVIRNNADKPIGLSPSDYSTYQIFEKDDLVFKLIDLNNISTSRVGLVPERGIMSSAYIRLTARETCDIRYFYLFYYHLWLRNVYNGLGAGVRQTLNAEDLLNLDIIIPPQEEQSQIVRFLDWKVSEISRLIANKNKTIALLEEHLNTRIENLVLHGIQSNNNAPTVSEFGFERAPLSWKIIQNKRLFSERIEHSEDGSETLLSVSKHYGVKRYSDLKQDEQYATLKPALSLVGYKKVEENDLVMNIMRARNGSYGISEYDGIVSPAYCIYSLKEPCNPKYIHYFMRTSRMKGYFEMSSRGIAEHRRRLYPDQFFQLFTLLPPVNEQNEIVDMIEKMNAEIENAISIIKHQVELLHELRIKIISDVVTGKIDVRGIEIPEYEYFSDTSEEETEDSGDEQEVDEA